MAEDTKPLSDAFGQFDVEAGAALFGDDPEPTPEPEAQPEPEAAEVTPEPAQEPQASEPEAKAEADQEVIQQDTPPAEEPDGSDPFASMRDDQGLILGLYKTAEDWAQGHKQLQTFATRTAQERAVDRRRAEEAEALIEKVKPFLSQLQQQPQIPEQLLETGDPNQIAQWHEQQLALKRQEWEAEQQQRTVSQGQEAAQQAIYTFQAKHPDAAVGGPYNQAVAQVMQQYVDDSFGFTEENLEVAYQLARNPNVKQLLDRFEVYPGTAEVARLTEVAADPNLLRYVAHNPGTLQADPEGWEYTKQIAALPSMLSQTTTQAKDAAVAAREEAKRRAHVEVSSTGAPAQAAPGQRPEDDDMNKMIAAWKQNQWGTPQS